MIIQSYQASSIINSSYNDPNFLDFQHSSYLEGDFSRGEVAITDHASPVGEVIGEVILLPLVDLVIASSSKAFSFISRHFSSFSDFGSLPVANAELIEDECQLAAENSFNPQPLSRWDKNSKHQLIADASRNMALADLEKLLDGIGDTNLENPENGQILLHYAAQIPSRPQLVKRLIEHGAKVDHKDFNGNTPLKLVTEKYGWKGHSQSDALETVEILIKNGADVNTVNGQGRSPLHKPKSWFPHPAELVKYLIKSGSNPNIKDVNGELPLVLCYSSSYSHSFELLKFLISKGLMSTNKTLKETLLSIMPRMGKT